MGVIAAAHAVIGKPRRLPCTVGVVLGMLDKADAAELQALLDGNTTHSSIERAMSADTVMQAYPLLPKLRAAGIGRHRARICACP